MKVFILLVTHLRLAFLNEMQYRANFFVQLIQSLFDLSTGLIGLALVFTYTETLAGWGPLELLALLGVYTMVGGAIGFAIQPSMQQFIGSVQEELWISS